MSVFPDTCSGVTDKPVMNFELSHCRVTHSVNFDKTTLVITLLPFRLAELLLPVRHLLDAGEVDSSDR